MDRIINLTDYLPPAYIGSREMEAITDAETPEMVSLAAAAKQVRDDQYVATMGEVRAGEWEEFLSIVPKATDTLEDRRFRVKARINEQLPYTITTLGNQLRVLCGDNGFSLLLDHTIPKLTVRIALAAKEQYNEIADMLARIVPCHVVIDLSLMYNQHKTLAAYTHAQLAAYTHEQLRNEVI